MFWLLFGWLIGENRRTARNTAFAALPEAERQRRYDAAMERRAARAPYRRWWQVAWIIFGIAVLIQLIVNHT